MKQGREGKANKTGSFEIENEKIEIYGHEVNYFIFHACS
jgi:hypothetical protein